MRLENPFRRGGLIRLPRAVFLALSLLAASMVCARCLGADQSDQEIVAMLTTGEWNFHGVPRTFNRDGTYSSKNATKGTWKINGNELDISLGRSMMRFYLPLDPRGTPGVSAGGIAQTLARLGSGDEPKEREGRSVAPAPSNSGDERLSAAHLVQTYHDGLVFVTGTEGAGSGFVAAMGNGNFLVTNVHVAAGIPGAEFKKLDGAVIQGGSPSMAMGEDIFCMGLPPGGTPLPVMTGVESNAAIGDDVVVLGNAEGEGVINAITGSIVGIGPNLVEVDAPFVPGNSGSPIIHLKTGKVIGVATYTITNEYDVTTNRKMAQPKIRRFGYRLDNVKQWQTVNWWTFRQQAAQMESVTELTDDLSNLLDDIVEHRGGITPGRHDNPTIKAGIDNWCEAQKGRRSRDERLAANETLLTYLKGACEADIDAAERQMNYDYFQRELTKQKQYRTAMAKEFEEVLLGVRR